MKLIRNKAAIVHLILLAVVVLAAAALALVGREVGLYILLLVPGAGLGMALVHLVMRRWGARKRVAALALVGSVALLVLVPLVGLFLGVGWLVYPSLGSGSPYSGFFFGLAMGAAQPTFGVLMGFDPPARD